MRIISLVSVALALLSPAFAQPAVPSDAPLAPPTLPKGVVGSWSSLRTETKSGAKIVIDTVGSNHLTMPAWMKLDPAGGIYIDGTQTVSIRLPKPEPVTRPFILGVDLNPSLEVNRNQTFIVLHAFCELRYDAAKSRLSLIVWQSGGAPAGDPARNRFTKVDGQLPAGKWGRVVAEIEKDKLRLKINDVVTEASLPDPWNLASATAPVVIANAGGGARAFAGRFDHLYFAVHP